MLKIGDTVKDFILPDASGKMHSLSDYRGKKVVIYFYPKNDTPFCSIQACSFRDNISLYHEKGIVVLGISKDSIKSHQKFNEKYHLTFPTLSDESREVITYFGAFAQKKMFGKSYIGVTRSTYVIDENGVLILIMPKVNAKDNALDVLTALGY